MNRLSQLIEGLQVDKEVKDALKKELSEAVTEAAASHYEASKPEIVKALKKEAYTVVKARARKSFERVCESLYNHSVKSINEESVRFKSQMVEGISEFVEAYCEEAVPETVIKENAEARFNRQLVENVRGLFTAEALRLDEATNNIVSGLSRKLTESRDGGNELIEENRKLKAELGKVEAIKAFKKLTEGCTTEQKKVLAERCKGYTAAQITKHLPSMKESVIVSRDAASRKTVVTEGTKQKLVPKFQFSEAKKNDILNKAKTIVASESTKRQKLNAPASSEFDNLMSESMDIFDSFDK
jgi:hypothetical protein